MNACKGYIFFCITFLMYIHEKEEKPELYRCSRRRCDIHAICSENVTICHGNRVACSRRVVKVFLPHLSLNVAIWVRVKLFQLCDREWKFIRISLQLRTLSIVFQGQLNQ